MPARVLWHSPPLLQRADQATAGNCTFRPRGTAMVGSPHSFALRARRGRKDAAPSLLAAGSAQDLAGAPVEHQVGHDSRPCSCWVQGAVVAVGVWQPQASSQLPFHGQVGLLVGKPCWRGGSSWPRRLTIASVLPGSRLIGVRSFSGDRPLLSFFRTWAFVGRSASPRLWPGSILSEIVRALPSCAWSLLRRSVSQCLVPLDDVQVGPP